MRRRGVTRRAALGGGLALAAASRLSARRAEAATPDLGPGARPLVGLNLAGADFGARFPGVFGTDYTYPGAADVDYVAGLGMPLVRLPVAWERLQPTLSAPLDEAEWARAAAALDLGRARGLTLWLDNHGYGGRRAPDGSRPARLLVGSADVPRAAFVDFWRRLVERLSDRPDVILGLMNEPAELDAADWADSAAQVIEAIRRDGSEHWIALAGTAYTGAHSWLDVGNPAMEAARLADPLGRTVYDVHQYMDPNSSGATPDVSSVSAGVARIQAFQNWARSARARAFLGETNVGRDERGLAALDLLMEELEFNRDVWCGWCGWAAGPWWPEDEPFRLSADPDGAPPPQTRLFAASAARMAPR